MVVSRGSPIFGVCFCDTGVGVAHDDVAIKFLALAFSCSSTGLKQEYDWGMGNRGEVFMTWEGFEPGTWSLELWDLKRFELGTL